MSTLRIDEGIFPTPEEQAEVETVEVCEAPQPEPKRWILSSAEYWRGESVPRATVVLEGWKNLLLQDGEQEGIGEEGEQEMFDEQEVDEQEGGEPNGDNQEMEEQEDDEMGGYMPE